MCRDICQGLKNKITLDRLLTIASLLIGLISLRKTEEIPDALTYIFGIYFVILAFLLAWREYVFSRKARYAEAMNSLHNVQHSLRDAFVDIINKDKESVFSNIQSCLNQFSKAFSIITGVSCRACIKTIIKKGNNFYVETFARSDTQYNKKDDDLDRIDKNTDFTLLFDYENHFFFSNNLDNEKAYINSHWPRTDSEIRRFVKNKEYDYIATIVWPIRGKTTSKKPEIIGFLCIDSKTRGVFNRRYDKDVGALVADALYSILRAYRNSIEEDESKNDKNK
jgi:hypothetical protein